MLSINVNVKRDMTKTSFYTTIEIKIPIMIFVCLGFIMPLEKYSHYELDMKGDLLLARFQVLRS